MKNVFRVRLFVFSLICACGILLGVKQKTITVWAAEHAIVKGVYVEGMDMSGMTKSQALTTIEAYVYKLLEQDGLIHLKYDEVGQANPRPGVLGAQWSNREIVDQLVEHGNQGHVVDRYKSRKALEQEPVDYSVELLFDQEAIVNYIKENLTKYDKDKVNFSLSRKKDEFEIIDGVTGYEVNPEESASKIVAELNNGWDRSEVTFPLVVEVTQPKGSHEELAQVTDLIGTFDSSFKGGTAEKVTNISNGATLINGVTLYPGEEFSFDAYAAPYTVAHGYAMGKSYSGGKLVDDVGGGICQVSSTLYNAVLRAELEITMRYNHSMIVGYVPISSDATLAETAGKDFRFMNDQEVPVYIESYITKDQKLIVNVWGKESRPNDRTVEYISETLEVIPPGPDVIRTDGTLPVGELYVSSAYTGYKAKLWKVVKVNGVEQSREQVNSSTYRAVARMATVGMYTTDAEVLNQMNAAVASGNIDHIKNVVAALTAPAIPADGQILQ